MIFSTAALDKFKNNFEKQNVRLYFYKYNNLN